MSAARSGTGRAWCARWALCVAMALGQLALIGPAHAAPTHKQVLVLYANRRDAQVSIIGENELPRMLDAGLERNLDYYSEFIDLDRFPDQSYTEAFGKFLRLKYQDIEFDLVIAMADAAIEFVSMNRDGLFRNAPVVYLSNHRDVRVDRNSTGVVAERNFAGTVALIEKLQPDARNVFVVGGSSRADVTYGGLVREQVERFTPRLNFTFLTGLPTPELERRLARLPAHSAVYYVLLSEDGAGNRFHPLEYVDRVAAAANAPTYSWVDSTLGHGVLGGSFYNQKSAIDHVGQLALRVLRGEPADSIAPAAVDLNADQVDWRQLRRWSIAESRIPAGALVSFREPTVWDRYRGYILGALAVVLMQSALITGLLVQRGRRRRAENELREHQGRLQRSYERIRDLGARLLHAQEAERSRIARELHDDISQQMALLTMDLEAMGTGGEEASKLSTEALERARGVVKSVRDLSHQLHPARLRLIGLVSALQALCAELTQAGTEIKFAHHNVPPALPPDLMLCLFRVAQESLQNALKYSRAREISLYLSKDATGLTLTIVDDGVGFDLESAWGRGLGLISIGERLEAIGATLEIRTAPGAGTRLKVMVPPRIVDGSGVPAGAPREQEPDLEVTGYPVKRGA